MQLFKYSKSKFSQNTTNLLSISCVLTELTLRIFKWKHIGMGPIKIKMQLFPFYLDLKEWKIKLLKLKAQNLELNMSYAIG